MSLSGEPRTPEDVKHSSSVSIAYSPPRPRIQIRLMESEQKKPGNYLAIDGGCSALPALHITEEICARIEYDLDSNEEVRVGDHCDILGGSGTGAVAAILLGRMGQTPSQAIDAYQKLEPSLSVQPTKDDGERRRNTEAFKAAFTEILEDAGFRSDTPMLDKTAPKTVVWTLNAANLSVLQPIRSYRVRSAPGPSFTILEAACASIASPENFLPVTVGKGHKTVVLIDAVAGYANPTKELLQEAQRVLGDDAEVASIVSLGAGKGDVLSVAGKTDEGALMDATMKMALDSEQTHNEVHGRLHRSSVYFRLNIERGLIGHMDASSIHAHTSAYMQQSDTNQLLNDVVKSIRSRQKGGILKDINSVTAVEITLKPRPSLVENFVGREDILDALKTMHFGSRPTNLRKPAVSVLMGLGGSGKTQTALRFALDYEEKYRDASVYFFNASSEDKLKANFELAIRARGSAFLSNSHDDALGWFACRDDDWLIIMDNADDPSVDVFRFIPKSSRGNVIITSRNMTHKKLAPNSSHHVEALSPIDASTLILKGSSYPDNEENRAYAELISKELGYLPLALAHAAAYISDHQCLPTYLNLYRERRAKFLATKPTLPEDYSLSVATAIQMCLDSISPTARDVMALLSRLDATFIAQSIIAKAAKRQFRHIDGRGEDERLDPQTTKQADTLMSILCPSGKWLETDFNDIVQQCLQYSLLQITAQCEARFYSMHVLVQAYLQSISATIQGHQPERLAVRLLGSSITIDNNFTYQTFNRLLAPHLKLIANDHVVEAGDHFGFGQVLQEQGNAKLSSEHYERCLAWRRNHLGDENMGTVGPTHGLVVCYNYVGRYQEALELGIKVLDLLRRVSGDEHPDTLRAMSYVALSYNLLGKNQESLDLQVKVMDVLKRVSGDKHPETLQAMHQIALSYTRLGRYQEGLELQVKMLDLQKRISGDEHPITLLAMNNLAMYYGQLDRGQEALELGIKVLDLHMRVSGEEHPSTLLAMHNVATFYNQLDRHHKAVGIQVKVLDLRKRVSGDDHSETLLAMSNLAASYTYFGGYEHALELDVKVLAIRKRVSGDGHPETLKTMANIASSYWGLGKYRKTEEILEKILEIRTETLGVEHPDTLFSMYDLAITVHKRGIKGRAISLLQKAIPLQERAQGSDHPSTIKMKKQLDKFLKTS